MGFIDFPPLVVIFCHFWPFLAAFGPPPWALGFLEHLHKEPDVYIYPLAMAPAKKTPLVLNSFHSYSFFLVGLLVVNFSPCWAHFGPLLGAKIFQSMTKSSLAPNSILWLWHEPQNRAYSAILMGFIDFPPPVVIFGHFQLFSVVFGPPLSPRVSVTSA